jgi:DNA-binding transcriptional regulator YbjK
MPTRREEILDAAVTVLGTEGARHLTHRAVDAAGGLPAGSTSNLFRTRDALLAGIVEHFAARERAAWEAVAQQVQPDTADDLAVALATLVRQATSGPDRVLTLARYGLFVEAGLRPELQDCLAASAAGIRAWGATWLRRIGSADPDRACRVLLDHLDGVMLHQVAFPDPEFDPLPALRTLLRALAPVPDVRPKRPSGR